MRPFSSTPISRPRALRPRFVTAVILLALLGAACLPVAPQPPTVIVYGDSFSSEASGQLDNQLQTAFPGWRVVVRSQGGAALCDFKSNMQDDANLEADLVIVQFSGNFFTPCITNPGFGNYFWDAGWTINLWHERNTPVLFVGGLSGVGQPAGIGTTGGAFKWWAERTAAWGTRFVDASTFLVEDGIYKQTLPCYASEEDSCTRDDDRINARNTDGGHLCNALGSGGLGNIPCPDYASGAYRFALAIVRAAAAMIPGAIIPGVPGPVTPRVAIPDFAILPTAYAAAESTLLGLGLVPSQTGEASDTVAVGDVVRTNPAAGQKLRPGKPITVYVSTGPSVTTTSTTTTTTTTTTSTTTTTLGG